MKENDRKVVFLALVGLFFSWVIYASFFVRRGLSLTDPGLICSQAWRFSLGDIPFCNVLPQPIGLSDYLLSIVLRIYPTCGLLGLRIAWAVILLVSILTAYIIVSRFYSTKVAFWAMFCSLSIFAMWGVNLPNYNNTPEMFSVLSIAFLFSAFNTAFKRKAVMYSIIAGIAAFLAAFCKVTFLGIIGVALIASFLALLIRSNIRFRILRSSIVFGITFFISLAIFIFWLLSLGLVDDFLAYSKVYSTYPSIIKGILFGRGSIWLLKSLPLVLVCLFFALMVAFWPPKKLTVLRYFYQLTVIFLFVWLLFQFPSPAFFLYGYSYTLIGIGIVISWIGIHRTDDEGLKGKNQLKIILFFLAVFLQWLSTVYSGNGIYASHKGMLLSLPLSIVVSYELGGYLKHQFKLNPKSILSYRTIIIMFAIIVGVYGFCFKLQHPYQDSPDRSCLSVPFKSKKLRGILSTSKHVEMVDRLIDFVSPLIKKGDYILVYPNLPMLYFLTDARPATRVTWFSYESKSLDKIAVEDLKKNKPKIVIRTHQYMCANDWPSVRLLLDSPGWPGVSFVNHYVKENYELINKIDAFEILVPKDKYIREEFGNDKVNMLGEVFYTKNKKVKLYPINFKSEKVWDFSPGKKNKHIEFYKIYNEARDSDFSFKIRYYPQDLKGFSNFNLNFKFLDKEGAILGALSYVLYGGNDHYYPVNEIIDGKVFATYVINPVEKKWKDLKVDSVIADYEKIAYKLQGKLYDELDVEKVKISISSRGSEREDSFMSVYLANLEINPKKINYSQIDKLISQMYPSVYREYGVTLFDKRYYVADTTLKKCIRDFQNEKVINFSEPRTEGQLIFSKEYQDIANSNFSLVVKYFPESIQGVSKFSIIFQLLDQIGEDLGMLTYVLYGTTDHYSNVNRKAGEALYATYIINPVEKEWRVLKVNSIIDDYNAVATRLEGKLWNKLKVGRIKVVVNSWSTEGGTISVYLKDLEVKREKIDEYR